MANQSQKKKKSAVEEILKRLQEGRPIPTDLLAQGLAEFDRIKHVIKTTREMRACQKRYYTKFANADLVKSKAAEKEADTALDNLWGYSETVPQPELFGGGGNG